MSLRARVMLGFSVIAVVLVFAAAFVVTSTRSNLLAQLDSQLTAIGPGGLPPPGDGGPGEEPRSGGGADPSRPTPLYAGYVDGAGMVQTLITPNFDGSGGVPRIDAAAATQAARSGEPFTTSSTKGDGRYRVRATVDRGTGNVMLLALPLNSVDDSVTRLVVVELVATVVILGVLALVAWWVIRLGVRPVKRMADAASSIAAGDLSQRVPGADPHTEVGELGSALNGMLSNIEVAFDAQAAGEARLRRFVSDASHELRTPVTTIRGYAELYRHGGLQMPGELDEAMRRTEQEAERMGALVGDLLQLARLDERRPMESSRVDLATLVADVVRDARAVAPNREVVAVLPGPTGAPVVVDGDGDRLRQAVSNVVTNALVHTEGTVRVSLRSGPDEFAGPADSEGASEGVSGAVAVLEVADHGPGMPAEAAARAFERFYRADPSRSRHRGGSGLGLSIVQSIVEAHGGRVELTSAVDAGTSVTIRLPLAPRAPRAHVSGPN